MGKLTTRLRRRMSTRSSDGCLALLYLTLGWILTMRICEFDPSAFVSRTDWRMLVSQENRAEKQYVYPSSLIQHYIDRACSLAATKLTIASKVKLPSQRKQQT